MPNVSQQYAVLIASPSDLPEERQAAKQAIWEWNDLHAEAEGVTLLPKMWETHSTPSFGDRPQGIINEQLVAKSDLLIGLFWTKIGSATGVAVSGTAEEIDQIVAAGKPAMLYFSSRPIDPAKIDLKQWEGLKAFKQETYKRALVGSFTSPDDLRLKLKDDLTRQVRVMKKAHVPTHQAPAAPASGDRLYAMVDRVEAAARETEVEEAAATKRAEARWTTFRTKVENEGFRGLAIPKVAYVIDPRAPRDPREAFMFLSVIPLTPLAKPLDTGDVDKQNPKALQPMGSSGWNNDVFGRYIVFHDGVRPRNGRPGRDPNSVTELTDDGCIFAATSMRVGLSNDGSDVIALEEPEYMLLRHLPQYVHALREFGVKGPLEVRVALSGTAGVYVHPSRPILWDTSRFRKLDEDPIHLPPVTITEDMDDAAVASAMRPAFTRVWRDGGLPHDPCFDPTTGKTKA